LREPANIDYIAVGRPGVFVIDAKRYYSGRIDVERRRGLLRPGTFHLTVGGRDKTKLWMACARSRSRVASRAAPGCLTIDQD